MCLSKKNIHLLFILFVANLSVIVRSKETNVWKEFVKDVLETNEINVLSKCLLHIHLGSKGGASSEMLELISFLRVDANK